MRTVVPLQLQQVIINGAMLNLGIGDTWKPFEADEQSLIAILESGAKVLVLDADGGTVSSNVILGFSSPNIMLVEGSHTITLPTIPSGNAQAFNGLAWTIKQTDAGAAVIAGTIDGTSNFTFSEQNESISIKIIDGAYQIV